MTPDPAFWNAVAEGYAAKPVDDPAAFERKIAINMELMGPDQHWLEVGCGTGSLALRLAEHAAQIDGLDISPEMLRIARGKVAAAGVDNITFHESAFDDSFDLHEDGSLDGVCAYSILHLMGDRPDALARIFRLLKPGGYLVSSTVCLGQSWMPYGLLLPVMKAIGKAPYVAIVSKSMLVDEVTAAGFVDVSTPDVGSEATVVFLVARKPL